MRLLIKKGTTSKRLAIFIIDSTRGDEGGLKNLLFNDVGLIFYYWREDEGNVGGTSVTLVTATLGTYTSGGFIEKDSSNMAGMYEIGIPDAALATGANWVILFLKGAADMKFLVLEIELTDIDVEDGVRFGMTALPNAAAEVAGGLFTRGTGAGQINQQTNGQIDSNLERVRNAVINTLVSGRVDVSVEAMATGVITATVFGTGAIDAAALSLDAGQEIADRVLARNIAGGSDGGRDVTSALRYIRNRKRDNAGTLEIYEENDTTIAWTAVATRTAGNPISEVDPA